MNRHNLDFAAARDVGANPPFNRRIWLDGPAGSGKTTIGLQRLRGLLAAGTPAESILVFTPQRPLAQPYLDALRQDSAYRGGQVSAFTIGSLARRMVEIYWFLLAERAGFQRPRDLPNFLSLELVQYFMTRAIEPLIQARDYFNSVRIDRARLYSQIIDNMNKAALVGFPITEIGFRLKSALGGGVEQAHIFDDAQTCAIAFRQTCLAHNLLDFSLCIEVFREQVLALPVARERLFRRYRHVIADNVEEDNPASHRFLAALLAQCDSALIIRDGDAGFRRFLGADPEGALALREGCDTRLSLDESLVMSADVAALGSRLAARVDAHIAPPKTPANPRAALVAAYHRYHPEMLAWVGERVAELVHERGVRPDEIVLLAPFVSDVLRFGLTESLNKVNVPARSHRPSRPLRDEPAARALLTFARLAHPHWKMPAAEFDVAFALTTAIAELDLVRAKLLTEMLYREGKLLPFAQVKSPDMQDRITYDIGARYDRLREWIDNYIAADHADVIDIFFRRVFGELLARSGFGFHDNIAAGNISMNLVDSARGFRWALEFMRRYDPDIALGADYVNMVDRGLIANFYLRDWLEDSDGQVLIAPAHTFLLANRPVDYQFWLNIGSDGWSRRLKQPLTHPHVLSRGWQAGAVWSDEDEDASNRRALSRLLLALARRCRKAVYLGYSELSESGYEGKGLLLEAAQATMRELAREEGHV